MAIFGSARTHAHLASGAGRAARWAWAGAVVLALALGATALWSHFTRPLYRSEAVVLYQRAVQPGPNLASPRESLASLQDELTSRRRLESVVRELALYPEIVGRRGLGPAVDELRRQLSIKPRDALTLHIAYSGEAPDLTQHALARLVTGAINDQARRLAREADDRKRWIDDELARADGEVRAAATALTAFLQGHREQLGEAGAREPALRTATDDPSSRADLQVQVAQLEMQKAGLEKNLAELRGNERGGGPPTSAAVGAQGAIDGARAELQSAERNLADRLVVLTEQHPDIKLARRRVAELRAALDRAQAAAQVPEPAVEPGPAPLPSGQERAIQNIVSAIDEQITALRSRSNRPPAERNPIPGVDTERSRLLHEVSQAQERRAQIEAQQFQARLWVTAVEANLGGGVVVVDPPARPSDPVSGRRGRIWFLGGGLGLLIALATVAGLSVFDDRLYAASDLERVTDQPILVAVSRPGGTR